MVFPVCEELLVPMVTLDSVLDEISFEDHIARVDFVKTDCQGADYQIALGATRSLDRIAIWTSEADTIGYRASENSMGNLLKFFHSKGFYWFNKRSILRRVFGRMILKSPFHTLAAKFLTHLKHMTHEVNPKSTSLIKIQVDDPTFINFRFEASILRGEITAFQKG
jgi:hypothetical protein